MAGHAAWAAMRSLTHNDPQLRDRKLAPDTWRRVLGYALSLFERSDRVRLRPSSFGVARP